MARPNTSSKNRRVRVRETVGDTVRLQPATPLTATARSTGADAAFALAEVLKAGGRLQESRDIRMTQQAEVDFQRGEVDENEGNRAYRRSVETLKAKARWYEDEAEFNERLRDIDLTDITLDELNGLLDQWYSEKYGDLDSPQVSAGVLEAMKSYREDIIGQAINTQVTAERAEIDTSLKTIAESMYDPENLGAFEYEGLNQEIQKVLPGAAGNETYWNILKDIAIRNGDVALIRNAPDRWADGTPTYTGNPDNAEAVLDAERRALAAAEAKKDDAEKRRLDAEKEARRVHALRAVDAAAEGEYGEAFTLAETYLDLPGAEPNQAVALFRMADSLTGQVEERQADEPALASLVHSVYTGAAGEDAIWASFSAGDFGEGRQATERLKQMLSVYRQNVDRGRSDNGRQYQMGVRVLADQYKPDRYVGQYDETLNTVRNQALVEYAQLFDNGVDPAEALRQVREKFDVMAERSTQTYSVDNSFQPGEALRDYGNGLLSTTQLKNFGVTVQQAEEAYRRTEITEQQYRALLERLGE